MIHFASKFLVLGGAEIELGAGVFPIKNSKPGVLATDILPAAHLDRVLDAQAMDLADESVSVIYGQNCFHHFPEPKRFFEELRRVLIKGGGAVLIEPAHGPLAGAIYKRLFAVEGYDKASPDWHYLNTAAAPLPNQALSYVCFIRERAQFESLFPELEIVAVQPATNWVRYLLSGGLNFKQLLPDFMIPFLRLCEWLLKPFARMLALHCYFVIRKRQSSENKV